MTNTTMVLVFLFIIALGVGRIGWQAYRLTPTRRAAFAEPVTFCDRVSVKFRYGSPLGWNRSLLPAWNRRVAGPMELRTRGPFVEVSMATPFPGVLLGVNRYLRGPETVMTTDRDQAPSKEDGWIILRGIQGGKRVEVAILPHGPNDEVLHALQAAGVRMG